VETCLPAELSLPNKYRQVVARRSAGPMCFRHLREEFLVCRRANLWAQANPCAQRS